MESPKLTPRYMIRPEKLMTILNMEFKCSFDTSPWSPFAMGDFQASKLILLGEGFSCAMRLIENIKTWEVVPTYGHLWPPSAIGNQRGCIYSNLLFRYSTAALSAARISVHGLEWERAGRAPDLWFRDAVRAGLWAGVRRGHGWSVQAILESPSKCNRNARLRTVLIGDRK